MSIKYDISNFLIEGKSKELSFAELFNNYSLSNKSQDIIEHWDVSFGKIKIDVKGLKKINRYDISTNENFHWIEIKGITGHLGWLYGEADYFAFETNKYWIIVCKHELQNFIKINTIKEYRNKEPYYLYTREGRKDIMTLITSLDLCSISSAIINKNTNNNGKT